MECESATLNLETHWVLGESVENVESKVAGVSLRKVNLMFLSKQATDKCRSLKTSLLKVSLDENDCYITGERNWANNEFFKNETLKVYLANVNFHEINFLYINQAYLTVKKG